MSAGTETVTRSFAAGTANFAVRCPSTFVRDAVEQLFVDLPDGGDTAIDDVITLHEEVEGMLSVEVGDRRLRPESPNEALATVVTSVSRLALDSDPQRLHLHCAALSRGKRGVLISAPSGTGKTMLATALALAGWSYVSDEAVALVPGSPMASGFPKPLLIKPGGGDLVPALHSARVSLDPGDEMWWLVPASSLPAPREVELEPSVIVILDRSSDGSVDGAPVATRMHPVDAVVALMGQTMDAERFGPRSAETLGMLAARCHCVSLTVGPLDAAVSILQDLIESAPVPQKARTLETPSEPEAGSWRVAEGVRSIVIGDRVVVHDTVGGAVAALDEAGTALWLALVGEPPGWWQPEAMHTPSTQGFLGQLAIHGLVERTVSVEPRTA